MCKWLLLTFGAVVAVASPVSADSSAGQTIEALSTSLTWIIVYLAMNIPFTVWLTDGSEASTSR